MTDSSPDNNKHYVFVSHGTEDMWVANRIAHDIQECGASTFLDRTNIVKGDNFKKLIHEEIAKCNELVVLFTPWSANRSWVWVEIGAAWGQGKRVIAVLYGISVKELGDTGGIGVLEDINVVEMNEFDDYLVELTNRAKGNDDA